MLELFSPSVLGTIAGIFMFVTVIIVRLRATKKPVSAMKIIAPPLFMSTGFAMFHFPEVVTSISYDLVAFCMGTLFSIPLILTSKFEIVNNEIYLRRSKAFVGILLTLFAIRLLVKIYVGDVFTPLQTAGLFFVLAFGMIVPWRVAMFITYRQKLKFKRF
ncbi:CcdC family protein [Brevibacillus sp. SYSU BS000544]|uniref:CcdC family protein n=1 Tax=Brevibacillus sp. SYSU BS000544 TaxID=3416443 RepID=UPI003CE5084C